jgi:oligoribonuclease (3'-5' exoribonuclease)
VVQKKLNNARNVEVSNLRDKAANWKQQAMTKESKAGNIKYKNIKPSSNVQKLFHYRIQKFLAQ